MMGFWGEHKEFWKDNGKHIIVVVPLFAAFVSFLYQIGFVDVPASRGEVALLRSRVDGIENEQQGLGAKLHTIEMENRSDSQKLDDVKQNVDRLVGALIDDGMQDHTGKTNYGKSR